MTACFDASVSSTNRDWKNVAIPEAKDFGYNTTCNQQPCKDIEKENPVNHFCCVAIGRLIQMVVDTNGR